MKILLLAAFAVSAFGASVSDNFYDAIRANDLSRLRAMLKEGASANTPDPRGLTPLMYAATVGSVDAMRILIDAGADVNAKNGFESNALMWSVTEIAKVRALVDHGANVNATSKAGRTPLLLAAMSDHSAEIVQFLIAKGANVKAVDGPHFTALNLATLGNDTGTIRRLIEAGVDVNAPGGPGLTPLINAAGNANAAAVKMLLAKGANVNAASADALQQVKNGPIGLGRITPLIHAATTGSVEVITMLLDAGADINAKDIRGMTPLMLAVATDHSNPKAVALLIQRGADVKAQSRLGETALDWARKFGDASMLGALRNAGATESVATLRPAVEFAPVALRPAVERSIALLEKTSGQFFKNGGCASCHHQNITDVAVSAARARGMAVNEAAVLDRQKLNRAFFGSAGPSLLERIDTPGTPDPPLYALASMAISAYPPDRMTDALLANVVAQQRSDGSWFLAGARPPIQDGSFFRTALGIRAIKAYGSPGRAAEMKDRIDRATAWLEKTAPVTTEDRNMQLLGLSWAGVKTEAAVAKILAQQREDGGWAQRRELASDAYATGQALYALAESGMSTGQAPYRKAIAYLLSTQYADGSWYVPSRAPKFQPYFDSGFPYGHDQWISAMATGWATAALALAIEPERANR